MSSSGRITSSIEDEHSALIRGYLTTILTKVERIGDVEAYLQAMKAITCCQFSGFVSDGKYFCTACIYRIGHFGVPTVNSLHVEVSSTNIWTPNYYKCLVPVGELKRSHHCLTCLRELSIKWKEWESFMSCTTGPLNLSMERGEDLYPH